MNTLLIAFLIIAAYLFVGACIAKLHFYLIFTGRISDPGVLEYEYYKENNKTLARRKFVWDFSYVGFILIAWPFFLIGSFIYLFEHATKWFILFRMPTPKQEQRPGADES